MKRRLNGAKRTSNQKTREVQNQNTDSGRSRNGDGRIVLATAGRDKGDYFLTIGEDPSGMAYIANGRSRPVQSPKLKKWKHLQLCGNAACEIKEKLTAGTLCDCDISRYLAAYKREADGENPLTDSDKASETLDC